MFGRRWGHRARLITAAVAAATPVVAPATGSSAARPVDVSAAPTPAAAATHSASFRKLVLTSEDHQAELWMGQFLGLEQQQLCPVFGFSQNRDFWIAFQVITSYVFLELVIYAAKYFSGQYRGGAQSERGLLMDSGYNPMGTQGSVAGSMASNGLDKEGSDKAIEELRKIRKELEDRLGDDNEVAKHVTGTPWDQERQALKRALQESINQHMSRWETERDTNEASGVWSSMPMDAMAIQQSALESGMPPRRLSERDERGGWVDAGKIGPQDGCSSEPLDGVKMMPIFYWAWQLAVTVIFNIALLVSVFNYTDQWSAYLFQKTWWAHYNLYLYIFCHSGMLPTTVQAAVYTYKIWRGSMNLNAIRNTFKRHGSVEVDRTNVGYEALGQTQEMQLRKYLSYVLVPLVFPLMLAVLTHLPPFAFAYPHVTIIVAVVFWGMFYLTRYALGKLSVHRTLGVVSLYREDILSVLIQVFAALFLHLCISVMTRIFSGEWRHGGYFNQLLVREFTEKYSPPPCTWFGFNHLTDVVLRWM